MRFPSDDNILLSIANTKLRDGDDIDGFCAEYGENRETLFSRLAAAGYSYDADGNVFKRCE